MHTTILCPRTLKTFLKLYLFILMDAACVCMSEDNLCKFSISIIWVERFEQVIELGGSFCLPAE